MEIVITTEGEAARLAADAVEQLIRRRPDAVLGLATGSSPLGVYDELARRHAETGLSFRLAHAFLLDEYIGLPDEHAQRYRNVIERELMSRIDLPADQVHGLDGNGDDLIDSCARYEEEIAEAGGVDLQVLGVGTDGHLAFNEPGSSLASRTRVATLSRQTREDNARFFDGDADAVPRHVLTQGLGTIMAARHLVVLAHGLAKAEAVHQMAEGPVSALWPATVVQHHPHVTVLVDEGAASRLQLAPYYRETWRHRLATVTSPQVDDVVIGGVGH
jgi:glucosamine-6-phosphate deaminase